MFTVTPEHEQKKRNKYGETVTVGISGDRRMLEYLTSACMDERTLHPTSITILLHSLYY